jgi:hypothetical protein
MAGEIPTVEVRSITSNQEAEAVKNKQSKEFYEAEKARIEYELASQQLELQTAQLEQLRRDNKAAAEKKQTQLDRIEQQQARDEGAKIQQEQKMEVCNHQRGGEGIEGLWQGDDPNFTINAEHDLLGRKDYKCSRCDATWKSTDDHTWSHHGHSYEEVRRLPHKGQRPSMPVTFTVPGVNAPLPPGWEMKKGRPRRKSDGATVSSLIEVAPVKEFTIKGSPKAPTSRAADTTE